jgi:2-alkyl-3-oxoalkanoate reductase
VKVLLTGATSLLGRRTAEQLAARGDEVTIFQRAASGLGMNEIRGDITSAEQVREAMRGQEAVMHLAAKVSVTGDWYEFERVNLGGTANVIRAAELEGVARIVYVSSPAVAHGGSALVGASAGVADPDATRGSYATSKAQAEVLALAASSGSMPIVAIRPHLVWGPGDTQLVGRIVDRARVGRLAFVGTGAALIDSTYVDNAADALVAALDRVPDLAGKAFVVSNAEPRTVHELVSRIVMAAGLTPPKRHVPTRVAFTGGLVAERVWDRSQRDDDPPMTSFLAEQLSTAHWFDQRATQDALHWQPAVSLAEGFERLAESFAE